MLSSRLSSRLLVQPPRQSVAPAVATVSQCRFHGGDNKKGGKNGGRGRRKRTKMDQFFDLYSHFDTVPSARHVGPYPADMSPFHSAAGRTQQPTVPTMQADARQLTRQSLPAQSTTLDKFLDGLKEMLADTNPRQIREHLDDYVIGQDAAKEAMSCAIYNHYTRVMHNLRRKKASLQEFPSAKVTNMLDKSNILMLGPSGSGKTLIAKRIADILQVPFSMNDATTFTQAGYVGDDVEQCISRLIRAANSDIKQAEIGIVFIDEVDKISKRSVAASGNTRDVSGEGVQQSLLKMLEGTVVHVSDKAKKNEEPVAIDTSNILFILSGAFVGLERVIQHRTKSDRSIGFGAKVTAPVSDQDMAGLGEINERDLIHYGLIPEFVGRIPLVVAVSRLSEQELVRILHETKNSLVDQYTVLFRSWDVDLEFTDASLKSIARRVMDRSTGARGLKFVMEEILKEPMYRAPGAPHIKSVRIDETLTPTYFSPDGQQLFMAGTTTAAENGMGGVLVRDDGQLSGMPANVGRVDVASAVGAPMLLSSKRKN